VAEVAATPVADEDLAPPAATPVAPMATPVGLEQDPGVLATAPGAEAITVEAMTSDLEVTPGQPDQYRFQLTNTVGEPVTVRPLAANSLPGWTGRILQEDGAIDQDGSLTIGPWQSAIVIIEVTVPSNARIGDLNTISLRLESVEAAEASGDVAELESALETGDSGRVGAGPA
jgi:hypothetical protein